MKPIVTAGIAYQNDWITTALDIDLTAKDRLGMKSNKTQFARAGVEFNCADWVQLRLGYRYDNKGNVKNMLTAGLELSFTFKSHFPSV